MVGGESSSITPASHGRSGEGGALTTTLGFAVILIYLVLAAQFQSFRDPLIVLLLGSVPSRSPSARLQLLEPDHHQHLLPGGADHAGGPDRQERILIVQFANKLQEEGAAKLAAIREASLTRLRPVLMTSAATVFGHLPLVFVTGPGSQARNSIGMVLVTGMTVETIFTLFVVPVFYLLIAAEHRRSRSVSEPEGELAIAK